MDRVAKRPRGFAFVSYADEEEAKSAIEGMHGKVGKKRFRSLCVCQTISPLAAHLLAYANSPYPLQFLDGRVIFVEVAKRRPGLSASEGSCPGAKRSVIQFP
jgi:transformer-2 protein/cold-inducible RNA-binding protein